MRNVEFGMRNDHRAIPHSALRIPHSSSGGGTRTRDPNLGKVVLYQLSYSRVPSANLTAQWGSLYRPRPLPPPCRPCRPSSGGEGDRTPDLVNAIHALSQLSYAPVILGPAKRGPAGTRHLIWTL